MVAALRDHRHSADHALGIDAPVRVEVFVLGRDEGLLDHRRNGGTRQIKPPLVRIFSEDRAVASVDARRDRRLVILERRRVRQIALVNLNEPIGGDGGDHEENRAGREEKADEPEKHSHRVRPRRARKLQPRRVSHI